MLHVNENDNTLNEQHAEIHVRKRPAFSILFYVRMKRTIIKKWILNAMNSVLDK